MKAIRRFRYDVTTSVEYSKSSITGAAYITAAEYTAAHAHTNLCTCIRY